jgi:hypothetical protein
MRRFFYLTLMNSDLHCNAGSLRSPTPRWKLYTPWVITDNRRNPSKQEVSSHLHFGTIDAMHQNCFPNTHIPSQSPFLHRCPDTRNVLAGLRICHHLFTANPQTKTMGLQFR